MGRAAAVQGDRITGTCTIHKIPGPGPRPAPPLGFSAPLTRDLAPSVLVCGRPAAVTGSAGVATPPHTGLHPADPYQPPGRQVGRVAGGSATVTVEGRPAATAASPVTLCGGEPGRLDASATSVLVG